MAEKLFVQSGEYTVYSSAATLTFTIEGGLVVTESFTVGGSEGDINQVLTSQGAGQAPQWENPAPPIDFNLEHLGNVFDEPSDAGHIMRYDGATWRLIASPFLEAVSDDPSPMLGNLAWPANDGTDTYVLATNGVDQLSWVVQTAGVITFVALTDTPADLAGHGDEYVAVNSGGTALEFITPTFISDITGEDLGTLSDVSLTGGEDLGHILVMNNSSAWVNLAPGAFDEVLRSDGSGNLSWVTQSSGVITFVALTDTPADLAGHGDEYVAVNSGGTALEFITPTFISDITGEDLVDLSDVSLTGVGLGHILVRDNASAWVNLAPGALDEVLRSDGSGNLSWVAQTPGVTTFVALTDTPADLAGHGDEYVAVNSGGTALEFITPTFISDITGEDLVDLSDVSLTGVALGHILVRDNASAWVNLAPGALDEVLRSDGSGNLSWVAQTGGIASVSADTTPALGGDLTVDGYSIVSTGTNDIALTPATGNVVLDGQTWPDTNAAVNGYVLSSTTGGALSWVVQSGGITDIILDLTPQLGGSLDVNEKEITSEPGVDIVLNAGAGGAVVLGQAGSATLSTNAGENLYLTPGAGGAVVLGQAGAGVLSTNVGEDLFLAPGAGGVIQIGATLVSGDAEDLSITPGTTGDLILDGLKWPQTDGTDTFVLQTNGSAQLSWVAQSGGAVALTDLTDVTSAAEADGHILRYDTGEWGNVLGTTLFATAAQGTTADSALQSVSADVAPALGADLTVDGFSIVSTGANDISLTPVSGNVVLDGQTWPDTNAAVNGHVLSSTTAGVLSWIAQAPGAYNDLTDVTIAGVADGHIVRYDTGAWSNVLGTTLYATAAQGTTADSALQALSDDGAPALGADLTVDGFSIVSTGANDISLTPVSGNVVLDGQTWPDTNAAVNGYVLSSTTGGALSWVAPFGGALNNLSDVIITSADTGDLLRFDGANWVDYPDSNFLRDVIEDLAPQLGGDLDVNGKDIISAVATDIVLTAGAGGIVILGQAGSATLGTNVGEDLYLTPGAGGAVVLGQAGAGVLSTNVGEDLFLVPGAGGVIQIGATLVSGDAEDLELTPGTTGDLILDGQKWPQADGSANEVLQTNGSGQLSWTPRLTNAQTEIDAIETSLDITDASGVFDSDQFTVTGTYGAFNYADASDVSLLEVLFNFDTQLAWASNWASLLTNLPTDAWVQAPNGLLFNFGTKLASSNGSVSVTLPAAYTGGTRIAVLVSVADTTSLDIEDSTIATAIFLGDTQIQIFLGDNDDNLDVQWMTVGIV